MNLNMTLCLCSTSGRYSKPYESTQHTTPYLVRFQVLKAACVKVTVFRDIVRCNLVKIGQWLEMLTASIIRVPDDSGSKHL
jgi:hypothetical protein